MPIRRPGRELLHKIPLKFVQKRVTGHGSKGVYASLNLTSMIDFLVIIVVFLLGTFSASGEFLSIQKGLELPDATQTNDLDRAPIIAITKEIITLDGKLISDVQSMLEESSTQGMRIEKVVDELEILRKNWVLVHPNEPFPGSVVLQVDKNVDFKVVKRAMFSAGEAGYTNLNLAVNVVGVTKEGAGEAKPE
ncbi:MAG: biopolymer transporter ExbD [Deltaproteobacteria bacterium]|nr:biopolymer transporter ExbD [Deltaproteobacteria bacterium]